jgi:hypothetical protein
VANAWVCSRWRSFSEEYEAEEVSGTTTAALGGSSGVVGGGEPEGGDLLLPWPKGEGTLRVSHEGAGRPWVTVRSMAAVPRSGPSPRVRDPEDVSASSKREGPWSRGDVVRVRFALEAQADMTWVS